MTEQITKIRIFNNEIDSIQRYIIYGILTETVSKWYARTAIVDFDYTVPLPIVAIIDDTSTASTDDADNKRLWCYL